MTEDESWLRPKTSRQTSAAPDGYRRRRVRHGADLLQIAGYLQERGTNLSRSRWTLMVNGHRYVQDPAVFEGLAEFFDVDAAFLLGEDGAATPREGLRLDLVRSMR